MKKAIKLLGIAVIAVIIGFALTACGGDPCTHSWGGPVFPSYGVELRTCNDCAATQRTLTLAIGATGEGGGIVFYRDVNGFRFYTGIGDEFEMRYYLEAARANIAGARVWAVTRNLIPGLSETFTDPTDWAIGRGFRNTLILRNNSTSTPAADATIGAHGNGKTDWFLPSRNELDELYLRRVEVNAAGESLSTGPVGWLWSSSQGDGESAWAHGFDVHDFGATLKDYPADFARVRAVRAF